MPGPMPTLLDYFPPTDPYLNVLHVDDDILVVDKQSGLLSVPGKDPSLWDCVEYRARQTWPTAGMCHRLDKDTSGVLTLALNKRAHGRIGSQFEHRQTTKSYVARVAGIIAEDSGIIDLPLATDWENKPRQRVDYENGRHAKTEWQVIEREANATRVKLVPLTGRTHQLRVHMLAIGHVILGDAFYAEEADFKAADRLQLHAAELGFTHPTTNEFMTFVAPTPF
ncbi:MAG: RluA family pseudouridine synthase [Hyphomicrobiales bacterium]|nr:MAG: RluA family pseudouridine synthase [Hyphomicrobiales bacterium]